MVIVEQQGKFTITKSDTFKIRKVGTNEIYDEAWDVLEFEYEETDIPLEKEEVNE